MQFSVHPLHLRRLQLVVLQVSSILEDNDVQHPVQIVQSGVDVSPVNLRAHTKGQNKMVSVNVLLVLNLHFNFISEDSNKRYSFADQLGNWVAG